MSCRRTGITVNTICFYIYMRVCVYRYVYFIFSSPTNTLNGSVVSATAARVVSHEFLSDPLNIYIYIYMAVSLETSDETTHASRTRTHVIRICI